MWGVMENKPSISVLIPVLNEEESLPELQERLYRTMEGIGEPYEIIYINDGSIDSTPALLEDYHNRFPCVKVIEFTETMVSTWLYLQGLSVLSAKWLSR